MDTYKNLTVVGEGVSEERESEVDNSIKTVESCGLKVVKILNFHGGSTKFIAQVVDGTTHGEARLNLEKAEWKMMSPYYSQGQVVGFKVAPVMKTSDVSAWGG